MPIKINKTLSVTGVSTPYTYHFGSTFSTVSFSNQTGTSSEATLSTDILYPDEATIGLSTINVTITDKNGCRTTQTLTVSNPCTNLTFISYPVNGYTASATVSSPGCSSVSFSWNYNATLLELIEQKDSPFASEARFKPKKGVNLPAATSVTVTATNCSGCQESRTLSMQFLNPSLVLYNDMYISCSDADGLYKATVIVEAAPNSTPIDWTTLDAGFGGSNNWGSSTITTEVKNGITRGIVTLAQTQVPIEESTYFKVYANDIYGVTTSVEGLLVTVSCINNSVGNIPAALIAPKSVNVPDTAISGDNIEIDVTYAAVSSGIVDWSTAQVLASPAYVSPSIAFATTPDLRQVINYEYAGTSDLFAWTVDDTDGNTLPPSIVGISVLPAAPVANTDNVDMVVGETEVIDVLSNDVSTGGFNPASVRIVTQSTSGGTATANSNGTITFVSDVTDTGGTIVQYKVNDIYNQESNTGSIIITRISAGNTGSTDLCAETAGTVNIALFDLLSGTRTVTTGGTWTNLGTASPSPAAPALYNDEITFTEGVDAEGVHTYRYTVTSGAASDSIDVTVDFSAYGVPSNNECAGAIVLSFSGRGNSSTLSDLNLAATCPGNAYATLSATPVPSAWGLSSYSSDVWYKFTATPYYDTISMSYVDYPILVTINGSNYGVEDGMFASAVAVYDGTCGALVEQAANVANVSTQNISAQVVMSGSSSKTYFIRVSSVTGYEGKYSVILQS